MLAMSCLDALLRADARWLQHLSGHGYLAALAESLAADDAPLCALLAPQPADPRPFYLYESKMVSHSRSLGTRRRRTGTGSGLALGSALKLNGLWSGSHHSWRAELV